ncbi:MAG: NAD-dependent epimerase [Pseudomonadota bacterium]
MLLTGAAGFIGFHTASRLLAEGRRVFGVDNLNDYYDPALKQARLDVLSKQSGFEFARLDIADNEAMAALFARVRPRRVINLAAQAGVRYSLVNPHAYTNANVTGFLNILEGCRAVDVEHLVYASTSSVFGANTKLPFSTAQAADHPITLYAATKRANELMAHAYASLFKFPTTGLRFFTVYGPWGRPDMSLFLFTKAILAGEPIPLFNGGDMRRDFTYVDDIVDGVVRVLDHPAAPDPNWTGDDPAPDSSSAPWRIFNIGNNRSVELMHAVHLLEDALGKKAQIEALPMQQGDVRATYADIAPLRALAGFEPRTPIEEGIPRFVAWYRSFYG